MLDFLAIFAGPRGPSRVQVAAETLEDATSLATEEYGQAPLEVFPIQTEASPAVARAA